MPSFFYRCLLVYDASSLNKLTHYLNDIESLQVNGEDCFESGLKKAGSCKYDVILLDLNFTHPQSRTIFKKFFSIAQSTPIIVISDDEDTKEVSYYLLAGAQDFLHKGQVSESRILQSIIYAIERKTCELKLRESYRMVANFTHDWEYWENPDGSIRYVSPACERVTGYSQSEFMNQPDLYKEIVIHQDREKFAKVYNRDLREKSTRKCYFRIRRKNGEIRWIEQTSQYAFDTNSVYLGIRVSNRDLTDLVKADEDLSQSEQKFQRLIEASSDAVIISDVSSGIITNANPKAGEITGRSVEELIGFPVDAIHPPEDNKFYREFYSSRVYGLPFSKRDVFLQHQDGRKIPVEVSSSVTGIESKTVMLDIFRDISERRRSEERLRQLSLAVEQSPASVMITNTGGYIEYVNPKFTDISGFSSDEVFGKHFREFKSLDVEHKRYDDMWSSIRAGRIWRGEIYNQKKDGAHYWESMSVSPITLPGGKITQFLFFGEDITLRKDHEAQLLRQANYDALTGLPNRGLLLDRLNQVMERVKREKASASLMFIDLDNFKDVNDSHGHAMGDRILVESARRLKKCVRNSDTVARLGGDEFIVLLPVTAHDIDASVVAERILEELSRAFIIDEHQIYLTASIGISVAPNDSLDPQVLLKNADSAMYKSKDFSRNTYHYFMPLMEEEARKRMLIKTRLRYAVTEQNFFLVYQPLLDVESEKIVGAEALIRWRDTQLGVVYPDQFIPLAEESHLIGMIGAWVIDEALAQAKIWQSRWDSDFMISINVSVQQINDTHFSKAMELAIRKFQVNPKTITLEIVERFMMKADDVTQTNLKQLRSLGVNLAVDDFGMGYSALGYFSKFSFDILKIDRNFLQDVDTDSFRDNLYQAILNVGQILELKVVSEGVETREHLEYIRKLKADWCQGYFFSRPVKPAAFEEYYQERKNQRL